MSLATQVAGLDAETLAGLGFRPDDVEATLLAAAEVSRRPDDLAVVAELRSRLLDQVGRLRPTDRRRVFDATRGDTDGLGSGVLALLALALSAPAVAAYHRTRGVPDDVSAASLADLGQQVWVHRLTYGEFGLHTYGWLTVAWSGALYRLGRLQFELRPEPDGTDAWVLSVHIPRGDALTPGAVDASFTAASDFFTAHFADHPTDTFFCHSWLLDPALPRLLPGSNLAAFQQRWTLDGDRGPGEADVLFFVFNRRTPTPAIQLPTDTALRRAVAGALADGYSWSARSGRCSQ